MSEEDRPDLLSAQTERARSYPWVGYVAALAFPVASLGLRVAMGDLLQGFPFVTFFPAVLGAAIVGGWIPGVLATIVSQVLAAYFIIEPVHSFSVGGVSGQLGMLFFDVASATTIFLEHKNRSAMARLAATGEALRRTNELLELRVTARTRELADANAVLRAEIAARQAAEAAILQAQKLEALGHLTGGIAHDYNNLLQAVTGSLELMQRRLAQGRLEQMGRYVEAAADAARRAALLTQRLLAFARRQSLAPAEVDLNRLIQGIEGLIHRAAGPAVTVTLQLEPNTWPVLCDASQLEAALVNLALNAHDAMPAGGRLTFLTRNVQASSKTPGSGDYVEIAATDTGTGMSEEVIARAFEPFFTTRPLGQGAGLGLSQLYGFVRQSHGDVKIESALGVGTTVRFWLPRVAEVPRAENADGPEKVRAERGRGTVLLVEDETVVRQMVAEALQDVGCCVLEAADGPEALRLLESTNAPDMLVSDVGLPGGLNGRQLADAVRERRPGLPVLLITGYAGGALERGLDAGMEVLTKPFPLETLVAAVRRKVALTGAPP